MLEIMVPSENRIHHECPRELKDREDAGKRIPKLGNENLSSSMTHQIRLVRMN